jgi:NAD(P)-dependent dehydrogenase (short-subunit alcohol dehydrogenase family)
MGKLAGKAAVVKGGSKDIGAAIAKALAAEGAAETVPGRTCLMKRSYAVTSLACGA